MQNTLARSLLAASLAVSGAVSGCGGGGNGSDGSIGHDGGPLDAAGSPAPPVLGAQIDRVGRPAISTLLVGTFTAEPARSAMRDAYSGAPDPATWLTTMLQTNLTIERELAINLAAFDALDAGMTSVGAMAGCGNALRYSGPASATSYLGAAGLFADDRLYVDTAKATCNVYLSLEIEVASQGSFIHNTCGGRTPIHDVIDVTYSVLAAGTSGLDQATNFAPKIGDGATVHGDVKDTFPFLGPPH